MAEPRESDDATRFRRQKKVLEALEKDNFQDDVPQAGRLISDYKVQLNKKLQQRFNVVDEPDENNDEVASMINIPQDTAETSRKRKLKPESKLRFRKNFATLLEEERVASADKKYSYFTIKVGASKFPPRKFCAVCGFSSTYTCIQCGTKYCSTKCSQTHKETRCLKWTA